MTYTSRETVSANGTVTGTFALGQNAPFNATATTQDDSWQAGTAQDDRWSLATLHVEEAAGGSGWPDGLSSYALKVTSGDELSIDLAGRNTLTTTGSGFRDTNLGSYSSSDEQWATDTVSVTSFQYFAGARWTDDQTGGNSFSAAKGTYEPWSYSGQSGSDSFSATGGGDSGFTLSLSVTYAGGTTTIGFTQDAAATGSFSSAETGDSGGTDFEHNRDLRGTYSLHAAGTSTAVGNSAPAYDLSSYDLNQSSLDTGYDSVSGSVVGTLATLSLLTVSGTGATGTASAASYATYTQGGSDENYSNGPTDTAAALAGPGEPNHAGLNLLQGWTEILEPGGADGLADPTHWPRALALPLPDGLVTPPLAPGVAAKYEGLFPYFTGWRVFAMTDRPWRVPDGPYNPATRETDWLTQASAGAGLPVNQWRVWALLLPGGPAEPVLDDAWQRFEQAARAADPLALAATKSWEALRAALPPGGSVTTDYWRRGVEWAAGVADQLTGGLFRTQFGRWLLNSAGYGLLTGGDLSLGGFINTQSGSYQAGQQAGQVVQIALTVWTPGGWLGVAANALRGYQLAGGLAQAGDVALQGRWTDAGWMAGQSLAMFAIQAGPCVVGAAAKGWTASKAAGEFAGSVAEFAAVWVTRGISVVQGVGSGVQGIQAMANGDLVGGMLQVAQGAADIFSAARSCFTGRTKVYARGAGARAGGGWTGCGWATKFCRGTRTTRKVR